MSEASAAPAARSTLPGLAFLQHRAAILLDRAVAVWVFCGGIVLFEPSPYEIAFLGVLLFAVAGNMRFYRSTAALLAIVLGFIPFAFIAAFQVKHTPVEDALVFSIVTIFLVLTSFFVANYIAEKTEQRVRLLMNAYTAAAVFCAIVGTLGYLHLIPGSEHLVLYGRAKATFKDPNVFGPFLVLPAMFALQRILLGSTRQQVFGFLVYAILFVGVFLSFSRAAWGHFAASSLIVLGLCFVLEADARQKIRILVYLLVGIVVLGVGLVALLNVPSVAELFEMRTQGQAHDMGESGRFGRQGYALQLALLNPLGLGPLEFHHLRIEEQPHNVYVTVLHHYGWGGGALYYLLVALTLRRAFKSLLASPRYRLIMIPLLATFVMLVAESAIIDTDHWRHWFLVAGLIWGVPMAEDRMGRNKAPLPKRPDI